MTKPFPRTSKSIVVALSPFAPRKPRSFTEQKATLFSAAILKAVNVVFLALLAFWAVTFETLAADVDASRLRGKVMCGYQGWFRCPGDAAGLGWVHWSRDSRRIAPATLSFEMWPNMADYGAGERFPAPGFTYPDHGQAELFSSDNPATVLRDFEWMRDCGLDGAWLQRFLVGLPGEKGAQHYSTALRVMRHVAKASETTGRVWAISYDIAGMPIDRIFDALSRDWKRLVDDKIVEGLRYLHQNGRPVVQIWGFYWHDDHDPMTPELANRLIDFFKAPGPYSAYLVGGGSWDWQSVPDPKWRNYVHRFDAYAPWNVGNYWKERDGSAHASTQTWAKCKDECARHGVLWMPVIYPGFRWDNLKRQPPGTSEIPRRKGQFLWEQFHALTKLGADTVYVAMFDEVDEGTAIFKVTSSPPTQGHFLGYEGLPSDWYLRLVGEGIRMLREQRPITPEIPIRP